MEDGDNVEGVWPFAVEDGVGEPMQEYAAESMAGRPVSVRVARNPAESGV